MQNVPGVFQFDWEATCVQRQVLHLWDQTSAPVQPGLCLSFPSTQRIYDMADVVRLHEDHFIQEGVC